MLQLRPNKPQKWKPTESNDGPHATFVTKRKRAATAGGGRFSLLYSSIPRSQINVKEALSLAFVTQSFPSQIRLVRRIIRRHILTDFMTEIQKNLGIPLFTHQAAHWPKWPHFIQ